MDKTPRLGDFTCGPEMLWLCVLAVPVGLAGAGLAVVLLRLIALVTNGVYQGRVDFSLTPISIAHLGPFSIFVPIAGALVIGLISRFGSERIRGHGIPEAIEAILLNGSRVQARVAILKPISSAISIGTGGPFGAEGPIIMTGGAFGSLVAQCLNLTGAERKTLLVAGAAAGMSATFAAPLASVCLAVELLLFEFKPRSLIPVAIASAVAAAARHEWLGAGPLFPAGAHAAFIGLSALACCVPVGLSAGMLSGLLTIGVYAAEDAFHKLPIHWMWWPAIGAIAVGVGGLIFPGALGVGYNLIGELLGGQATMATLAGILLVKSTLWIVALGSGTSGGVLAPLLMIGGALGGLEALWLPHVGPGFWPLIAMGAILGGTMRSPLTGVVFVLELTHDFNAALPLLIAVVSAEAFTVLALKRSILTEKLSRRGRHVTREYAIDPLELHLVRDVVKPVPATLPAEGPPRPVALRDAGVVAITDAAGALVGALSVEALDALVAAGDMRALGDIGAGFPVAHPDETLRVVVYRMAETGHTCLPVIERSGRALVGLVTLTDMLHARSHWHVEETRRERVRRWRPIMRRFAAVTARLARVPR